MAKVDVTQLAKKYNDLISKDLEDTENVGFVLTIHDFNNNQSRIATNFGTELVPGALLASSMEADAHPEIEERTSGRTITPRRDDDGGRSSQR